MANEAAVEMFVGGLVLDPSTQAPIVVLKDDSGQITLPIWIGVAEATSIASAMKQVSMARPLTHDLFYDVLLELGITVQRVTITELKDSTYFSELIMAHGDRIISMDARPSDAIAMALRATAPIFVSQSVLDQARLALGHQRSEPTISEQQSAQDKTTDAESVEDAEDDSSKDFRAIDKDKWSEILSQLDPDDFKYKM